MIRTATILLLIFPLSLLFPSAQADKNLYGTWIKKLGGPEDAAMRQRLLRAGTPALRALREAVRKGTHAKVAAALIAEIEKREPFGLQFSAGMPKMALTPRFVSGDRFSYAVRVRNRTERTVTLWPYLSLRVLDQNGKEVEQSMRIGRGGLRLHANVLAGVKFAKIKPHETWSFKEKLSRYMHDAEWICGWKVLVPGTYTLEFTYHFDRAAAKKRCDPKWERLNGADEPWNKAIELKHTFTTEMRVGKP